MKNKYDKIYLQVTDEDGEEVSEVTWCSENINGNFDIVYYSEEFLIKNGFVFDRDIKPHMRGKIK